MVLDQFSIFYIITFLSAGITAVLAFWALRFRYVPGSASFSVMLLLITIWTLSIGIGMGSPSIETANNWIIIRMIGVIFSPLAWIIFVFDFTHREQFLDFKTLAALSLIPLASTVMLITNPMHHLFIESIQYVEHPPFLIDKTWQLGPYYWVHFVYSYLLILVGDFFMLKEAYYLSRKYRAQAIALAVGAIFPLIVNFLYTFKVIPGLIVNYDSLGLVISSLIFTWAVFNYQLFDFSPVALRVLVDNIVDGIIVIDSKHLVVDINPAALKIINMDKNEAIGKFVAELLSPPVDIETLLGKKSIQNIEFNIEDKNGIQYYELSISLIQHHSNDLGHLITIRDVTHRKNIEFKLQKLAITDSLTGLSNHRHFYELLEAEFKRAVRRKHPLGLIMLDIDHFKNINDLHGHLVGDQILRDIAEICQDELRAYDHFCRYGGEEFTVILPETTNKESAQIAERLRQKVAEASFNTNSGDIQLTISLGVSNLNPENTSSVKQFVQQADTSLYRSKTEGRNRVSVWQGTNS